MTRGRRDVVDKIRMDMPFKRKHQDSVLYFYFSVAKSFYFINGNYLRKIYVEFLQIMDST